MKQTAISVPRIGERPTILEPTRFLKEKGNSMTLKKLLVATMIAISTMVVVSDTCKAQDYVWPRPYAQEPSWQPNVVATGQTRLVIENTPIEFRPYRPFHFYGNAVRRYHYRGNPLPTPRDFAQGTAALFGLEPR